MDKQFKPGDHVTYIPFGKGKAPDIIQRGRIKEIHEEGIFVVYNCENDWVHYKDYNAEWTAFYCLEKGWK